MDDLSIEKYHDLVKYLDKYWIHLIKNSKNSPKRIEEIKDEKESIFLPYDYIVPGGVFDMMFYWDSFFIIVGLQHNPKFDYLIKNITDNCLYMVDNFGRVLNCNKKECATRSQLPYLTSMINIVYDIYSDDKWLDSAYKLALKEYKEYWCSGVHLLNNGLARFYEDSGDNYITRNSEVSWDTSPRYDDDDTVDLAPVDLNSNLFLYEIHFSEYFTKIGNMKSALEFKKKAEKRKDLINEFLWSEEDGLFYDFNFSTIEQKKIKSLASYVPLWVGLVNIEKARKIVSNLDLFEYDFGLSTCDQDYGFSDRQWNYPFGWAPLQWMVIKGLKKYDFTEEAFRIAFKWLNLNLKIFEETHAMWEKYDVVDGGIRETTSGYLTQKGFGWTNGVFIDLFKEISNKFQQG